MSPSLIFSTISSKAICFAEPVFLDDSALSFCICCISCVSVLFQHTCVPRWYTKASFVFVWKSIRLCMHHIPPRQQCGHKSQTFRHFFPHTDFQLILFSWLLNDVNLNEHCGLLHTHEPSHLPNFLYPWYPDLLLVIILKYHKSTVFFVHRLYVVSSWYRHRPSRYFGNTLTDSGIMFSNRWIGKYFPLPMSGQSELFLTGVSMSCGISGESLDSGFSTWLKLWICDLWGPIMS